MTTEINANLKSIRDDFRPLGLSAIISSAVLLMLLFARITNSYDVEKKLDALSGASVAESPAGEASSKLSEKDKAMINQWKEQTKLDWTDYGMIPALTFLIIMSLYGRRKVLNGLASAEKDLANLDELLKFGAPQFFAENREEITTRLNAEITKAKIEILDIRRDGGESEKSYGNHYAIEGVKSQAKLAIFELLLDTCNKLADFASKNPDFPKLGDAVSKYYKDNFNNLVKVGVPSIASSFTVDYLKMLKTTQVSGLLLEQTAPIGDDKLGTYSPEIISFVMNLAPEKLIGLSGVGLISLTR